MNGEALYVEIDPFAAEWLRALIMLDHIAPGDVYCGSLEDLTPEFCSRYTQVHLCAGIGVWSLALRNAGWPDSRPVWTASFPCQPFSAAGQGAGFADERHLWPAGFWLIDQCRPVVLLGEQVASKPGLEWFDLVSSDLEGAGYTIGAHDLCAAGVGAPHIRQRLYFVAHADAPGRSEQRKLWLQRPEFHDADGCGAVGGSVAYADGGNAGTERQQRGGQHGQQSENSCLGSVVDVASEQAGLPGCARIAGGSGRMADGGGAGLEGCDTRALGDERETTERSGSAGGLQHAESDGRIERGSESVGRRTAGFWGAADWIPCRDGKWRPVEPGTFPLAHGAPARVGRLRGYGNAIVAPVAEAFIKAVMEDI